MKCHDRLLKIWSKILTWECRKIVWDQYPFYVYPLRPRLSNWNIHPCGTWPTRGNEIPWCLSRRPTSGPRAQPGPLWSETYPSDERQRIRFPHQRLGESTPNHPTLAREEGPSRMSVVWWGICSRRWRFFLPTHIGRDLGRSSTVPVSYQVGSLGYHSLNGWDPPSIPANTPIQTRANLVTSTLFVPLKLVVPFKLENSGVSKRQSNLYLM
jgi:hypothetical protein